MLVLDDPGIRRLPVRVIDDRVPLEIIRVQDLRLKPQAAVLEPAEPVTEIAVYGSHIDHLFCQGVVFFLILQIIRTQTHLTACKQLVNDHIIAAHGDPLVQIVEIIVVVGIAHREALDDKRRKVLTFPSPLLFRIALDQLLVDMGPNQADGLLLQVFGLALYDLSLFLYDLFCLLRRGDPPHTAEGIHIKRHIVHLALIIGHRAVGIAVEFSQAVDKIPNLPAAGMEDMGAVFMDMDALGLFTVNVPAQMIPFFQHQTFFSLFSCKIREHSGKQAAPHQQIVVLLHSTFPPFSRINP